MSMKIPKRWWLIGSMLAVLALVSANFSTQPASANHGLASGHSFTYLDPGFVQEIFGVTAHAIMGGVAFAPDGDPWWNDCGPANHTHRFDRQGVAPEVNNTRLHPESILPSNLGCGLTNHPNGSLYSNTNSGVVRLDANTAAPQAGPFGATGNNLGIAVDPQTGNLVYVGTNGTIQYVDAGFTTSGVFSAVTAGNFIDGIFFDPTGNYLFLANRSPSYRVTILNRDGTLLQHVAMNTEPDGIAFHAMAPKFVVTTNINGSMTRFDFPGDDFSMTPTPSIFADGGFRGDLAQVGADGCIYVSQNGTRYDSDVTTNQNSLVRICPGFAPPPGVVSLITLDPESAQNPTGTDHTLTATVTLDGAPAEGVKVDFKVVTGPNAGEVSDPNSGECTANDDCTTDSSGRVNWTYTGTGGVGTDGITACFTDQDGTETCSGVVTKEWIVPPNADPDCDNAGPSQDTIWPANHEFVAINVLGVTDPDGDPISVTVDSIWQDEPVDTYGDDSFTPDGQGVGTDTAEVRAERVGTPKVPGNGRVYHIFFTAADGQGGSCSGEVLVSVPHDQGQGSTAVDDGALYDSTVP